MKRLTLAFLLCVLAIPCAARAQILTGDVIGTIRDESGGVLPGVSVTLTSPAAPRGPLTATTNDKGEYRFTGLNPGSYTLEVTLSGFTTYKEEGLRVAVSGTTERNVALKLGTVSETITVSGESPMVDTRRVATTTNLPREVLEVLPNHRYYFTEYVKWSPGVSSSDPTSPGQTDLSVLGSTTDENTFLYDGADADRPAGGGPFSSSDHDAVEEIQVVTLGASAEYQLAQGAVVNVVYKTGTNNFTYQGSAFWFPDSLTSKPFLKPCNCPLGQTGYTSVMFRNYNGHVGGPIVKDKLWFFGGGVYSARIQTPPGTDPSTIKTTWYSHKTFAKVTYQVNDKWRFRAHHATDPYGGQATPTIARPFNTLTANYGLAQVYSTEVTNVMSASTLLSIRATGAYALNYPSKPLTGDITTPIRIDSLTGVACCGVASFNNQGYYRHGQAVKLNRYIRGARTEQDVRGGVQFEQADYHSFTVLPGGVNYSDINGQPNQATFRGPAENGAQYRTVGLWAEDQLTMGGRLTVSAGLRYDRMHAISPDEPLVDNTTAPTGGTINGLGDLFTWNVWSPRLGFNLKLTGDGKTVMRGNYGRAYRQIFLNDWLNVHPGNSPTTLTRWTPATNGYTTIISVTDPLANIGVDHDVRPTSTDSWSIGLDRELIPNLSLSTTYVHKDGRDRLGWIDTGGVYGTRDVALADGRTLTVLPLLNATSARKFVWTNAPGRFNRYNGLIVAMSKRMSHRWQGSVSYTYSKAEGLVLTGTTGQDPNDQINASGLLGTDRPRMFLATVAYEIPKIVLMVVGNLQAVSGNPYAPQALVTLPQGTRSVNITPPDGSFRYPSEQVMSIKFDKILFRQNSRKLNLGVELMNLLQDTGITSFQTLNFFAANFKQANTWIEPRRLQIIARFTY